MKSVLIVCNTRTGSTAIGGGLQLSNTDTVFLGEAFHFGASAREHFMPWLDRSGIDASRYCQNARGVISEYLRNLADSITCSTLFVDVKYHDLIGHMERPSLFTQPSAILRAAVSVGFDVIHLVRRDKIACFLSEKVSALRGQHHLLRGDEIRKPVTAAEVSLDEAKRSIAVRILHERIIRMQLKDAGLRVLEISYEGIFGDQRRVLVDQLSSFLERELHLTEFPVAKIGGYELYISNVEYIKTECMKIDWDATLRGL